MESLFFNSAAIGKISPKSASIMSDELFELSTNGPDIRKWVITMEKCRRKTAELLGNSSATGVAFVQNTSQAISLFAEGLEWERGDEIIIPEVEYPANQYPWYNLERRGAVVVPVAPNADGGVEWEDLEGAVSNHTKLIAISHVQFMNGYRCNIKHIAENCRKRGILLLVDVIQSAGVVEIKQEEWGVDCVVAGAQKWLKGPPGIGILSLKPELVSKLTPVMTGAFSVKNPHDVQSIELSFHDDAHRFESGTMNFLGFFALLNALNEVSEKSMSHIRDNANLLRSGLTQHGFDISGSEKDEKRSGIVTVTHSTINVAELFDYLTSKGVTATYRTNSIRFAAGPEITEKEINALLECISLYR